MTSPIADGLIVTWRNLKRIPRIPELAIYAILQSIMFVLLFAFVFGGAIPLPGYPDPNAYREYLMPGIFGQTIVFAAATTTIGMTDDVNKGIIDRFRSLPMARSAVLIGRSLSDVVYNAGILIVLMLSGLVVGWTVRTGLPELIEGIADWWTGLPEPLEGGQLLHAAPPLRLDRQPRLCCDDSYLYRISPASLRS